MPRASLGLNVKPHIFRFNAPSNRGRDNRETFSLKTDIEKPKENPPGGAKEPSKEGAKENPKESKAKP